MYNYMNDKTKPVYNIIIKFHEDMNVDLSQSMRIVSPLKLIQGNILCYYNLQFPKRNK